MAAAASDCFRGLGGLYGPLSRFPAAIFFEHRGGGGGAAAGDPQIADLDEAIQVAHAAGGFDLHLRRATGSHQREVMLRRAAIIIAAVGLLDEAVAGGGLDPIRHGALANAAERALQLIAA